MEPATGSRSDEEVVARRRGAWSAAETTRLVPGLTGLARPPGQSPIARRSSSHSFWPQSAAGVRTVPTSCAEQVAQVGIEPVDARIPPEPGPLAAGEDPGPLHREPTASSNGSSVLDVIEQLAVSDRLPRCARQPAGLGRERPHLVEESLVHQLREAPLDTLVVERPLYGMPTWATGLEWIRRESRAERGEGQPEPIVTSRALHDPTPVRRLDPRCRDRVELVEPRVERLGPDPVGVSLETGRHLGQRPGMPVRLSSDRR